jgi:hypothetical protein
MEILQPKRQFDCYQLFGSLEPMNEGDKDPRTGSATSSVIGRLAAAGFIVFLCRNRAICPRGCACLQQLADRSGGVEDLAL